MYHHHHHLHLYHVYICYDLPSAFEEEQSLLDNKHQSYPRLLLTRSEVHGSLVRRLRTKTGGAVVEVTGFCIFACTLGQSSSLATNYQNGHMKYISSLPPTRTQPCALPWEQSSGSASKLKNAKGEYDDYLNTALYLDASGLSIKRQLAAAVVHLRLYSTRRLPTAPQR